MNDLQNYKLIVIGTSLGGMNVLKTILSTLPSDFEIPVTIVQHIGANAGNYWTDSLDSICRLHVKEADEKENLKPGYIYGAPPNYHLLLEPDGTFSLSIDERVNYARPSIDVLFESAAFAYKSNLIGVLLSGASSDGANGLALIKKYGGLTIVQDPETAEARSMPEAGSRSADYSLSPDDISRLFKQIHCIQLGRHEY